MGRPRSRPGASPASGPRTFRPLPRRESGAEERDSGAEERDSGEEGRERAGRRGAGRGAAQGPATPERLPPELSAAPVRDVCERRGATNAAPVLFGGSAFLTCCLFKKRRKHNATTNSNNNNKNFPGLLQRVITKDCSSAARCHGATLDSNCLPFEPASSGIHYIN